MFKTIPILKQSTDECTAATWLVTPKYGKLIPNTLQLENETADPPDSYPGPTASINTTTSANDLYTFPNIYPFTARNM